MFLKMYMIALILGLGGGSLTVYYKKGEIYMYKIMIIEDDNTLCSLLKDSLEKYDYEVYISKKFKDLVEEFKEIQPDLVLLDILIINLYKSWL